MNIPQQWTLSLTLNGAPAGEQLVLLEQGRTLLRVYEEGGRLCFAVRCYEKDAPLTLSLPLENPPQSAELVWLGYRLELWADGVLADEEWPMGSCMRTQEVTGRLSPQAALDYRLTFEAEARTCLAPAIDQIQYWAPDLGSWNVGDCMPFWDDGVYHLFYLKDRHGHQSKWGKGAHQFAHISTRDLIHWEQHQNAIEITHPWEGSICTGSILKAEGRYYAFYAVRMMDETSAKLSWAVSEDCIHFVKSEQYFTLSAPYETTSARDPEVFLGEDGLYHMLVTTNLAESQVPQRSGCLAHLVSRDLAHWEQRDPFLVPGYTDQPECTDYFSWNGWYYLIFSNYGTAKYRYSRSPFGPWIRPENEILDGLFYRVPKTAAFTGGRRIAAGFLPIHPEGDSYAGNLVLREVLQQQDGTLATGFVPELSPAVKGERFSVRLTETPGCSYRQEQALSFAPGERILMSAAAPLPRFFGLTLTGQGLPGTELRIDTRLSRLSLSPLHGSLYAPTSKRVLEGLSLEKGFSLELILTKGILDLCVNGNRTLVCRLPGWEDFPSAQLGCFVMDGSAAFDFTK